MNKIKRQNLYLTTTPAKEALDIYLSQLKKVVTYEYETVPVQESLGRVTKEAVYAKYCSPLYNASAMDGIAVVASHTVGADEATPITLTAGDDYMEIDTGDPIRAPFDAVIMSEVLLEKTEHQLKIVEPAFPWQHVRPIGEDIVAGELILTRDHLIRPIDIGVLLSAGVTEISVQKQIQVGIFPTGTEMIEPGTEPKDGDIIESNSQMFVGLVTEAGGIAHRHPAIADDYDLLKSNIVQAVKAYDMVLINAGSSAGREDFTVHVLQELGTVLIHGVAIKPGKPVILALVNQKPVIGLPGYPVSAYIDFEMFVQPVLSLLGKRPTKALETMEAVMSRRVVSGLKYQEYIRVKVGQVGDKLVAAPLARGAGAAMSLVRADGFCIIDQNHEGLEAGERVMVQIYRPLQQIKNTLMVIGSHDLMLDVLADLLPSYGQGVQLSSTHVGSMGGLMSLARGEAHLAPIHLLDEESGIYNIAFVKQVCKEPMALIKGVGRQQGFLLQKGNPKNIKGLEDMVHCSYVNRQRGSGTRILLDYQLKKRNIDAANISGYRREVATHMAVAAIVKSGSADAGLGILAAAKVFDLDFVAVDLEEYDFALPVKYLELPQIKELLRVLQSEALREKLESFGGYCYDKMGEVLYL
ncbi:MAG: molybdopterin biosynthesis protein [Lachnospiraceae bacterium]|nr:molybdopterin biosynthesis protein [Lachnospiraceae bacterium]